MSTTGGRFAHLAWFYRSAAEYLAGIVPFICDGLDTGQPVMVAVPRPKLDLLRDAMGPALRPAKLHDMGVAGRNPGRIIPALLLDFAAAHPGQHVRIIGEHIWPGRSREEYLACVQHEALINRVFTGRPATILCPYDAEQLDPTWLHDSHRTHPTVLTPQQGWGSAHDENLIAGVADFNQPLPDPPASAATITISFTNLPAVRRFVTEWASQAGLSAEKITNLTIAVGELASNTIEHADGIGRLAVWVDDNELICQVSDRGYITDPLAGRIPVPANAPGGHGLLLVNQLCDLVRIHTTPQGTTIRVQLRR